MPTDLAKNQRRKWPHLPPQPLQNCLTAQAHVGNQTGLVVQTTDGRQAAAEGIGFAAARRRSELAVLDVAATPEGLVLAIRHSKTDQAGWRGPQTPVLIRGLKQILAAVPDMLVGARDRALLLCPPRRSPGLVPKEGIC
jgi:hypothetical protein